MRSRTAAAAFVAGASNYYLMYKSRVMVDYLLEKAATSGFNVIRMSGAIDIGNQDARTRFAARLTACISSTGAARLRRPTMGRTGCSISVLVKPDPNAALKLFSFETGTEEWASATWQSNAGAVAQSTEFAADGTQSLKVTTDDGGCSVWCFPRPSI